MREYTKIGDRARIPQTTKQFARYGTLHFIKLFALYSYTFETYRKVSLGIYRKYLGDRLSASCGFLRGGLFIRKALPISGRYSAGFELIVNCQPSVFIIFNS